ncbi:IARS isoform 13, partial [Pongo abelii]
MSNKMVQQVPENINFPAEEEKILEFWTEFNCFQECLKQSKHKPKNMKLIRHWESEDQRMWPKWGLQSITISA